MVKFKQRDKEIKEAFKKDCLILFNKFENLKTFNFAQFSEVWQKMRFSCVHTHFETKEESRYFTDATLLIAKNFFKFPKNIYTQVGSLYLLYGLYYKQPYKELIKIRMTLDDYDLFEKFIEDMKQSERLQPIYVYAKLKFDNAFQYCYSNIPLAPDLTYHKREYEKTSYLFKMNKSDSVKSAFKNLLNTNITELDKLDEEYRDALSKFKSKQKFSFSEYSSGNIGEEIKQIFQSEVYGVTSKEEDLGKKRTNLKKKASETTSEYHRTSPKKKH